MEIVIGADHGQGTFKAGVVVTFRQGELAKERTVDYTTGEVICAKDTAEVMWETLAPLINEQCKRMMTKETATGATPDGKLGIYRSKDGASVYATFSNGGAAYDEDDTEIATIPFKLYVAGGLGMVCNCSRKGGCV
jgi:hypothetical protein